MGLAPWGNALSVAAFYTLVKQRLRMSLVRGSAPSRPLHTIPTKRIRHSLRSWNPGMSARLLVGCITSSITYSVVWHTRVGAVSGAELPKGMPSTCVCMAH